MALNNDMRLQFRMGSKSGLDAITTRTPGTVYVTTDEQAMYVDINAEKRIRISDIIQLNSPQDLGEPPYSTEGFYYFVQDNALMKCKGPNAEGGWDWQQLNSVSDVTANLTKIEGRVTIAEAAITSLKTTVNGNANTEGLVAKVATLTGNAETEGSVLHAEASAAAALAQANKGVTDAATAQAKANENAGLITNVTGRVSTAEGKITIAEADIDALEGKMTTAEGKISTLEAYKVVLEGNDKGSVAEALKAGTDAAKAAEDNAGEITTIKGRLNAAEGTLKTVVETTIPGINGQISAAEDRIEALEGGLGSSSDANNTKTAFKRIEELETLVGGGADGSSISDKLDAVIEESAGTTGKVNRLMTTVEGHGTAIDDINDILGNANDADSVFGLISKNTTDIGSNFEAINGLKGIVGDANSGLVQKAETNRVNLENVKGRVEALETNIPKTYVTKADYATDKAALDKSIEEQHQLIENKINAANGMEYKDIINAYSDLPTTNVKVGATYLVANPDGISIEGKEPYRAGDLLIANGTEYTLADFTGEDEPTAGQLELIGTIKPDTLVWDHVKTGYIRKHEATLDTVQLTEEVDGETVNKNATDVKLVSHLGDALGKFTIQGAQNVTVAVENDVITVGMAWDTF